MTTTEEVLKFCNEFTFYNHQNIERIKKLDQVRDCIFNVLSKYVYNIEKLQISILGIIDDISLMVRNGYFETLVHKISRFRNGFSQLLCLEEIYEGGTKKGNKHANTIKNKEVISLDKLQSFQDKIMF